MICVRTTLIVRRLCIGSNHHLSQKVGIVSTLMKRLELVSKGEDKDAEISILQDAFRACNYPDWSLKNRTREKKNAEQDQQSLAKICK